MDRKLIRIQLSLVLTVLMLLPVFAFAETPQAPAQGSQTTTQTENALSNADQATTQSTPAAIQVVTQSTPAAIQVVTQSTQAAIHLPAQVPASTQAAIQAPGQIRLVVNGTELLSDQKASLDSNRVLVPIRGIFELMGASVSWEPHTNTAAIKKGTTTLSMKTGSPTAAINGKKYEMDVPPKLQNNRLMVPVRFISEHLGMKVNWDQEKQLVSISDGQESQENTHAPEVAFDFPHYVTSLQSPMLLYHGILYYCGQDGGLIQCYSAPLKSPQNSSLALKTDEHVSDDPGGNEFYPDFYEKNGQVFFHYRTGMMIGSDKYFQFDENGVAQPFILQRSSAMIEPYGDSKYVYMSTFAGDSDLYLRSFADTEQRIGDPYYNYIGHMILSGDSLFVTGFEKGDAWNHPASSLWQIDLVTNQIHQTAKDCSDVLGVHGNDLYFLSRDKKIQKIASFAGKPILSTSAAPPVKLAKMTGDSLYFVDSSGGLNVLDLKSETSKRIMKPSAGEITQIDTNGNLVAASCFQMPDCTLAVFGENGRKLFTTNQPVSDYTLDQNCLVYSVQGSNLVHIVSLSDSSEG